MSQHGATAVAKWQAMSTVYEAPESEALLAVMVPVGQETTALATGFTAVARALTNFADTAAPIVAKLKGLKAEAVAFVAQAEQGYDMVPDGGEATGSGLVRGPLEDMGSGSVHRVEWMQHLPYVQRNDELIMAVATQATALDEAQADCVNAIAAAHPSMSSCAAPVQGTDFATAAREGERLPFGQTAVGRSGCVESFGGGMGDAATGMVEGLGALIAPTPVFQVFADDSSGVMPGWTGDFSKSTLDKQQQLVDGFVGSKEQWQSDPARVWGSLFVNVGSLLLTAWSGAAPRSSPRFSRARLEGLSIGRGLRWSHRPPSIPCRKQGAPSNEDAHGGSALN